MKNSGRTRAIFENLLGQIEPFWPQLAWALGFLALLILVRVVYLLFLLPTTKYKFLLEYEDSRLFTPFVAAELYCRDYPHLPWDKLGRLLIFFILGSGSLVSGGLIIIKLLHFYDLLPFGHSLVLPFEIIVPACFLFSLLLLIASELTATKLRHYYRNTSFFHQSAITEEELRGQDGLAKGMRGEYYAWRLFQVLPQPRYILISPIVPKPNGSFAEIDLVVLSRKGIFCVEAKNREGVFLSGHHTDLRGRWRYVQAANEHQKARVSDIESPLVQNQHHVWTLANFWKIDTKYIFNVLCFGKQADLKHAMLGQAHKLSGKGSLLYYGQRFKLYQQVSKLPDILGESLIERLYKELSKTCQMSRVRREAMLDERQSEWKKRRFQSSRRQSSQRGKKRW